eukprot:962650-Ditylum_brightwellii.AAC.1
MKSEKIADSQTGSAAPGYETDTAIEYVSEVNNELLSEMTIKGAAPLMIAINGCSCRDGGLQLRYLMLTEETQDWNLAWGKNIPKRSTTSGSRPTVFKYGIKVPCNVVRIIKMDGQNGKETYPEETTSAPHFTWPLIVSLETLCCDIDNAYVNAYATEKVYAIAGLKFVEGNVGKNVIIRKAVYGLATLFARFHDHISDTL